MTSQAIPRPVLVALALVADVILLAAGWFLVVAPQRHHAASAAEGVTIARSEIQEARSSGRHSTAPAVQPKQPAIQTSLLYRVEKAMPDTEDQPDLLLELDQVARAAGVTVLTLAPGKPTAVGTTYSSIPIQLTVQGDFYSLTDLLYRLRSLVAVQHGALDASGRLFAVDSVSLQPLGTGKQLSADVAIEAFVYGTALASASATTTTSTDSTSASTTSTTTTTGSTTSGTATTTSTGG